MCGPVGHLFNDAFFEACESFLQNVCAARDAGDTEVPQL